ncbi:MAG: helix-turn-helix transcriptional regulator [Oligoflexales bacterium]|nr:helix-turn-helix transcriptional regulator [Oligoflexales bacterium]
MSGIILDLCSEKKMPESDAVTEDYKLLLKKIGEQINKARVERGLSQRELARVANKTHTVVTKVEKTPPLDLSLRSIYELACHIPISMTELMAKAERDLELKKMRTKPGMVDLRIQLLFEKISELSKDDRSWMADMMDSLLSKTKDTPK